MLVVDLRGLGFEVEGSREEVYVQDLIDHAANASVQPEFNLVLKVFLPFDSHF